jgi:uncharacterized protein YjbI with pentapeptide repeats
VPGVSPVQALLTGWSSPWPWCVAVLARRLWVRVDHLSGSEQLLRDAFQQADTTDLRVGDASEDALVRGRSWGPDRVVRAGVIAGLLQGACEPVRGVVPAVRLFGARITGVLDLDFAEVAYAALLRDCYFEEEPRFHGARLRRVNLSGSRLPGVQLSDAVVDGLLVLDGCRFDGPVKLTGCRITETLFLRDADLRGNPVALWAESLSVGRDFVGAGMTAHAEVSLRGARVEGEVTFAAARLASAAGRALSAEGLTAGRGIFFRDGFTAEGEVRLSDARVGWQISMTGAALRNPGGVALDAERMVVDGAAYLDGGFTAYGEVRLRGASIGGDLQLAGAHLANPGGVALAANRVAVGSGIYGRGGLVVHGEIQLGGAEVRGWLNLEGAHLVNPAGAALVGWGMDITGRLFCGTGFRAEGELSLTDAHIAEGVFLEGSALSNPGSQALSAQGLTTRGVVNCCDGFSCEGSMSFASASIGSELCFDAATIQGDIRLRQLRAATLRTGARTQIAGILDLRHATVEVLRDALEGWPEVTRLAGFTYTALEQPLPAGQRLQWLARDDQGYHPQPYEHLAAVYRAMGNDADARAVLYQKQRARRGTLPIPLRAWGLLQDWVVGYGYRPQRAALWFVTLLAIGTSAFAAHHPAPLGQAPQFSPFLYTLDLLVPLVGFGQKSAFNPVGWQHWLAAALIAAGWILATTIAAGITRALARQ